MTQKFDGNLKLLAYAGGMAGWSVMMNMVSVMLVYFYLPPGNAGLPQLIPQVDYFGIMTLFALVLASGRLFDAVTDPLIAWTSDRFKSRWGRRVPFMFVSVVPAAIFSILLFYPLHNYESYSNYAWLFFMQLGFYLFLTIYIVPFNALMPELAHTTDEKLKMSVVLSLTFVLGIVFASQIPFFARLIGDIFNIAAVQNRFRLAMAFISSVAAVLMYLPLLVVREKKYCKPVSVEINIWKSIKTTLSNRKFLIFLLADSSFFITLAIISSGLLYYVRVLLGLPEENGTWFLAVMIGLSLVFYPLVVRLVKKFGKKKLIIISFFIFSFLFLAVIFMGKLQISPGIHLYSLAVIAAFPVAVLGILPYTIIADIAQNLSEEKDIKIEGMFFAVRTFGDKLGQTLGVMCFAILTLYGKDPGNDLGIRLSALAGMIICLLAAIAFFKYRE